MRAHIFLRNLTSFAALTIGISAGNAQTLPITDVHSLFTANTETEIPGQSLKPGSYTIHIVNHLPDRYILRVDDTSGKAVSTFIGLRDQAFSVSDAPGPVVWSNAPGKKRALRGFVFPQNGTVEFVYPKDEAVELAKLNESSVPAIDPQSEGRPAAVELSEADRQVVTLWILTPTRVGTGKATPAIEAERFHGTSHPELAENMPPPVPSAQPSAAPAQADSAPLQPPAARLNDKAKASRVVERLPQTASYLPLVLLFSCLLLAGGFGVALRRGNLPQA